MPIRPWQRRVVEALSRPRVQVGLLLAAAACVHVGLLLVAQRSPYLAYRIGDEAHYHAWAHDIAAGALARPPAFFTTPLFAYYLAAVYRVLGDSIAIVQLLNVALGVGTVALTYGAGARLVGHTAALVGAALVAFTRGLVFQEWLPEKTLLVLFLTALALYALSRAVGREGSWGWFAAGIAVGAGALAHALLLVLVPATLLAALLRWREDGAGRVARRALALVGGAGLAIAPATLHNAVEGGGLVLICSNGGQNLYVGNHAGNPTGAYTSPPFAHANLESEEQDYRREAERRVGRAMGPGEVSAFWSRQAIAEMWAAPRLTAIRYLRKLRWVFGSEDVADSRTYEFYLAQVPALRLLPWDFGVVALLGLLGLGLSVRDRDRALLAAFVALFALSLAMFFVYGRYRLPLLIPLALLAGVACGTIRGLLPARRPVALATTAAAAALLAIAVFGRVLPEQETSFFADYYNQGNRYVGSGRVDLAVVEYERAITVRPGDHPAVAAVAREVAMFHLRRGDTERARRILEHASRIRPGDPGLARTLASLPPR